LRKFQTSLHNNNLNNLSAQGFVPQPASAEGSLPGSPAVLSKTDPGCSTPRRDRRRDSSGSLKSSSSASEVPDSPASRSTSKSDLRSDPRDSPQRKRDSQDFLKVYLRKQDSGSIDILPKIEETKRSRGGDSGRDTPDSEHSPKKHELTKSDDIPTSASRGDSGKISKKDKLNTSDSSKSITPRDPTPKKSLDRSKDSKSDSPKRDSKKSSDLPTFDESVRPSSPSRRERTNKSDSGDLSSGDPASPKSPSHTPRASHVGDSKRERRVSHRTKTPDPHGLEEIHRHRGSSDRLSSPKRATSTPKREASSVGKPITVVSPLSQSLKSPPLTPTSNDDKPRKKPSFSSSDGTINKSSLSARGENTPTKNTSEPFIPALALNQAETEVHPLHKLSAKLEDPSIHPFMQPLARAKTTGMMQDDLSGSGYHPPKRSESLEPVIIVSPEKPRIAVPAGDENTPPSRPATEEKRPKKTTEDKKLVVSPEPEPEKDRKSKKLAVLTMDPLPTSTSESSNERDKKSQKHVVEDKKPVVSTSFPISKSPRGSFVDEKDKQHRPKRRASVGDNPRKISPRLMDPDKRPTTEEKSTVVVGVEKPVTPEDKQPTLMVRDKSQEQISPPLFPSLSQKTEEPPNPPSAGDAQVPPLSSSDPVEEEKSELKLLAEQAYFSAAEEAMASLSFLDSFSVPDTLPILSNPAADGFMIEGTLVPAENRKLVKSLSGNAIPQEEDPNSGGHGIQDSERAKKLDFLKTLGIIGDEVNSGVDGDGVAGTGAAVQVVETKTEANDSTSPSKSDSTKREKRKLPRKNPGLQRRVTLSDLPSLSPRSSKPSSQASTPRGGSAVASQEDEDDEVLRELAKIQAEDQANQEKQNILNENEFKLINHMKLQKLTKCFLFIQKFQSTMYQQRSSDVLRAWLTSKDRPNIRESDQMIFSKMCEEVIPPS